MNRAAARRPRDAGPSTTEAGWRFGEYEFRTCPYALSKRGTQIALRPQPARLLMLLLRNAGRVVDRSRIREELWGLEVHVNFEQSINYLIRELRKTLGDSARDPRFLETVPQVGYRFVATISEIPAGETVVQDSAPRRRWGSPVLVLAAVLLAVVGFAWYGVSPGNGGSRRPSPEDLAWIEGTGAVWQRGILLSRSEKSDAQAKGLELLYEAVDRGEAPESWRELVAIREIQIGSVEKALALATRIRADKPDSPDAHYVLGIVALFRDYRWAAAEEHLAQAVRSEHAAWEAMAAYAKLLSATVRHSEALGLANEALARDPLSTEKRRFVALLSFHDRRFEETIALAEELLELRDRDGMAHWLLLLSHYLAGREEEARRRADAYLGDWGWPRGTAKSLPVFWDVALRNTNHLAPGRRAFLLHRLGETRGALEALMDEACTEKRSWNGSLIFVDVDPTLAGLRPEPEFSSIRKCLNLSTSASRGVDGSSPRPRPDPA